MYERADEVPQPAAMATATDHNPNQTKVPGVARASHPTVGGGNSEPEVGKSAPGWQQALAGNYKQVCECEDCCAVRAEPHYCAPHAHTQVFMNALSSLPDLALTLDWECMDKARSFNGHERKQQILMCLR